MSVSGVKLQGTIYI